MFTYDGNYYALEVMTALGLEESGGAVRAGYLHYTTADEAARFCDALDSIVSDAAGRAPGRVDRRTEGFRPIGI